MRAARNSKDGREPSSIPRSRSRCAKDSPSVTRARGRSGRSRPAMVRTAHRQGYQAHAIFLGTDHVDNNIARVRRPMLEGGHHVPENEIRRRRTAARGACT